MTILVRWRSLGRGDARGRRPSGGCLDLQSLALYGGERGFRGSDMNGRSITLFELLGFKIRVDISWLFLAVLVTWSLALGAFPLWYGGLAPATYWLMGLAGMLGP